jgi:hypothetical protein
MKEGSGSMLAIGVMFVVSVILLIGAVFLYTRREENDISKLNANVVEMLGDAQRAVQKSGEAVTASEKAREENLALHERLTALEQALLEVKAQPQAQRIIVEPASKPFYVQFVGEKAQSIAVPPGKVKVKLKEKVMNQ